MNHSNTPSRRQFLAHAAALAGAGSLASLNAGAATLGGDDYRALVCVFLYGGNDGNNTVIPMDSAGYAAYAKARGNSAAGGLALQQSSLAPLNGAALGLHPGLAPLANIWNQGHLAIQANVGTLVQPLSKVQYAKSLALHPPSLFSHSDQQGQWMHGISGPVVTTGWGGRIADLQGHQNLPTVLSLSGNSVFINGASTAGLAIPPTGGFGIRGFGGTPSSNPLFNLYNNLLKTPAENLEVQATSDVMQQALQASSVLNPLLNGTSSSAGLFKGLNDSLAQQLQAVAKVIESRHTTGATRQIFFVSLGGFDTHNDQLNRQANLLGQVGTALKAFYDATNQLGVASHVTTFTASDFARTLQPDSTNGSDHAWGSHHFIMGGSVKSGLYGTMPQLLLGGSDDVTSEGRWLPTTSVEQMGATLASWLGVDAGGLSAVFPHLDNFSRKNMGYFG